MLWKWYILVPRNDQPSNAVAAVHKLDEHFILQLDHLLHVNRFEILSSGSFPLLEKVSLIVNVFNFLSKVEIYTFCFIRHISITNMKLKLSKN